MLSPWIPRPSGLDERGPVARVFLIGFDDGEEGAHACETGEQKGVRFGHLLASYQVRKESRVSQW